MGQSQGRNQEKNVGEAKPIVGHDMPTLIEIGLTYLEIKVRLTEKLILFPV